jgi:hypothetical protein
MSLRMSRRKWAKMTYAERAAEEAARAAAERGVTTRARKVVEIWNARTELLFYPTFRTAFAAGLLWLEYMCPACRQVGGLTSGLAACFICFTVHAYGFPLRHFFCNTQRTCQTRMSYYEKSAGDQ